MLLLRAFFLYLASTYNKRQNRKRQGTTVLLLYPKLQHMAGEKHFNLEPLSKREKVTKNLMIEETEADKAEDPFSCVENKCIYCKSLYS